MTRRQRAATAIVSLAIGLTSIVAVQQTVTRAIDMCVTNWEDGGGGGDTMTVCDTPSNLKVSNLGTHTEGLHNGCNRGINQSSSWTDCISSARVFSLPASYRVRFYQNTAYTSPVKCWDANGTSGIISLEAAGVNDTTSSFRVEGGNC